MCVWVHACVQAHAHIQEVRGQHRCHSYGTIDPFSFNIDPFFLSIDQELHRLGWLEIKPKRSTYGHLPSLGVTACATLPGFI